MASNYEVTEIETIELTPIQEHTPDEPEFCPCCNGYLQWQGSRVGYVCLNCLTDLNTLIEEDWSDYA